MAFNRAGPHSSRTSMRPPPRPHHSHHASITGRAPSPALSHSSTSAASTGVKRKERDFEADHGEETNINVVVRCRGRSDREVRENSGVVVSTSGVRGKTVDLSMGPNAISNKTYQFDKVFSPAADQTIIFEDVVAPVLDEMLTGFNCTIFAYGQTGTGKTYTMSGDMTDTLGLLSDAAGIIPRVLYSLFQKLDSDEVECSVKCSFIELYNEELKDLLSMDDSVKLKIYDDASKKSHTATMVQGMEETHIKTAAAGIQLLQRGSHRRQVAATKCNDLSSRSHTVFTITTYLKKVSETGEDYICAGKLNLVDLAGSENIQRSGAENKRAAEAGLINKSLLTLGRVINALVDRSSHIPYRESKLTRLLQDSLGGRTKTYIIATVSPAKSNLEETISTLDYAFRAKNIRNKVQVNSTISKKTLLKEYTAEIEKLKSELIATRQRNGVYLTNEQYEEITVESESRRILSDEQRARIETMESSLRNKVQELFSLTNNFTLLKRDNESTRTILESTKDVLVKAEAAIADTNELLEDEKAIRQAHQATEEALFGIGTDLVSTVGQSLGDLSGLEAKLRRRSELHALNSRTWGSSVGQVAQMSGMIESRLSEFEAAHSQIISSGSSRIEQFLHAERGRLQRSGELIVTKANELGASCKAVEGQSSDARDAMNNVLEEIKVLREEVKEKVGEGLNGLSQAAEKISAEVISELEQFHTQLHSSYSGLGKDFKNLFDDLTQQLSAQRQEAHDLRSALEAANRANIEANLTTSSQLQTIIEEEHRASEEERDRLKEQICAMIDASSSRQHESMSTKLLNAQSHMVEQTEKFEAADTAYRVGMEKWNVQDGELLARVVKSRDEVKSKMKTDWTGINTRNTAIQRSTKAVHEQTVMIVDAQLQEMAVQMAALDEFVTRARSQNDDHHSERLHSLGQLATEGREGFNALERGTTESSAAFDQFDDHYKSQSMDIETLVASLRDDTRLPLQELRIEMSKRSMTDYVPTGETPQKREWHYPTSLPKTQKDESIKARRRGLPDPHAVSKTPPVTKTPGRSPRKMLSPRKGAISPSKVPSPSKTKVFNDARDADAGNSADSKLVKSHSNQNQTISLPLEQKAGLKELDVNLIPRPTSSGSSNPGHASLSMNPANHDQKAVGEQKPVLIDFSKSLGSGSGQPPLKRHATTNAVVESRLPMKQTRARSTIANLGAAGLGMENFSSSIGSGRRLRSSPAE